MKDGRRVRLRQIRPDDGEALQAAVVSLSAEARYMRFMGQIKELSPGMLERAVRPAAGRDLALVALADPGAERAEVRVVGGARYVADPEFLACEFAVAVADDWHGVGLASRLMKELIRSARERGLKVMEGFILASNTPMRNLARRLGFETGSSSEGPGVVRVWLDLQSGRTGGAPGGNGPA
jgi:GNAT superfamily N-acetyltransferase